MLANNGEGMNKTLILLTYFILSCNIFSQGFYGSIGYRLSKPTESIDLNYVAQGFNYLGPDYITDVKPSNSLIIGTGYRWLTKEKIFPNSNNFGNVFGTMAFKGFDYEGYDYGDFEEESLWWVDWSIGAGFGTNFNNGLTISADLEYNITVIDDDISFDYMPTDNFLTLNINFGFMQNKGSSLSHFGVFGSKITGDHFLNELGPSLSSTQFSIESGYLGIATALLMVLYPIAEAGSDDLYSPSSTSSTKGCHVYGKIKFVEFGEDYKVKFVSIGEDLKIKYVSILPDSPGEWQVVEFGEDYKIKIVEFGEDFKVKEVSIGEGCN